MTNPKIHVVSSENFSSFNKSVVMPGDEVSVRINPDKEETEIARLITIFGQRGLLFHTEHYFSPTEFATITMKQSLTLYVKRRVIALFPDDYTEDDPKVHSYVSRLSYEGIKFVADNVEEFAEQFHSGRITMKIPKNKFNDRRR